jgi:LuxR family quorum sensing-dependent transcriptional regulator
MAIYDRTIFSLVDQIAAATGTQEVWSAFLGETSRVGLDFGYLSVISFDQDAPARPISMSMPRGWEKGYVENSLVAGDMLFTRARASKQSFAWHLSDWNDEKLLPAQKRWREHNGMFGIKGGLSVLDFHPGEEAVLTLCGEAEEIGLHDRLALYFAGHEAIHRLLEFTEKQETAAIWLSQRERQCLEWAAAGKTDWEIGQILSLSEKTVNVYITRAKSKFGVKTRAQAILKASKVGAITI